jgi:hypothetical protein
VFQQLLEKQHKMADYFNNFPLTFYSSGANNVTSVDTVTNIIARFGFESTLKENSSAFYPYFIKDSDTPEIIATKIYNNPERHWIVLMFNDIMDPQYEWPLSYEVFNEYVDKKYSGPSYANNSISGAGLSWAKSGVNVQAYYKIVTRTSNRKTPENKTITERIQLDANTYANVITSTATYTLSTGEIITETITKETKTYYQYENDINDEKRKIKILKPEFVSQVMKEFKSVINPS